MTINRVELRNVPDILLQLSLTLLPIARNQLRQQQSVISEPLKTGARAGRRGPRRRQHTRAPRRDASHPHNHVLITPSGTSLHKYSMTHNLHHVCWRLHYKRACHIILFNANIKCAFNAVQYLLSLCINVLLKHRLIPHDSVISWIQSPPPPIFIIDVK